MPCSPGTRSSNCRGFTIVEMSVVLVVIALIIGAVSIGRDVYRSAMAERIGSEFVQGWLIAYDRYVQQSGIVPGDNPAAPTGRINGRKNASGTELCDSVSSQDLRNAMLERGISLPQGRAEGQESRFVYQDSHGVPQELQICFNTVTNWAEPEAGGGYKGRVRNVMVIKNLTPELAQQLDARIDGRVDARFGRLRDASRYSNTSAVGSPPSANPWSADDLQNFHGGTAKPDDQIAVVTAYLKMNQ